MSGSIVLSRRTATIVALLLLQSCAPDLRALPGISTEPKRTASLVLLKSPPWIIAFDDTQFDPPLAVGMNGSEYIVPAGYHTVTLRESWGNEWKSATGQSMSPFTTTTVGFSAKPGARYQVTRSGAFTDIYGSMRVSIAPHIIDVADDAVVSTVVAGDFD
jgi:hypothetical protein